MKEWPLPVPPAGAGGDESGRGGEGEAAHWQEGAAGGGAQEGPAS